MKKTTRTLLGIGGAFCLIGALLFGIGFVSGGTKYVHATNLNAMNAQSDQDAKENHFTLEKTELSDFNSLNVNLKNSDFNIKESPNEKSYIEYVQETTKAKNPLSYSIKNNTLTLKENGNTGASYTVSVDISFLQPLLSGKNMASYMDEKASSLPYGAQRRLEIARALATSPDFLLLDEPAAGMNPQESTELMRFIRHIRDEFDLTILLIEHDMKVVMGVCQYIWVLEYGQLIAEGDPDAIRNNPRVIEAYLGEDVSNHA